MFVFYVFFFFQAEDGIRDHCVTGVQTCALPILPPAAAGTAAGGTATRPGASPAPALDLPSLEQRLRDTRSEERRVGKECRSRESPYRSKKKEARQERSTSGSLTGCAC